MTLIIIDIAHWESVSDWIKVKEAGVNGVYIKATQGKNKIDKKFYEFRAGCESVGLPWGAYHFYDSNYTGLVQSAFFVETMKGNYGQLPPCLDFEPHVIEQDPPRSGCLDAINSFMNETKIQTNKKPIIYTNRDHINLLLPVPDWLLAYDLWFAWPSKKEPNVKPWKDWVMWQYSWEGKVPGVEEVLLNGTIKPCNVDMNHAKDGFIPNVIPPIEPTHDEKVEIMWKKYKENN